MSGKGGQTVGYHYLFTFIAGLGRGPLDAVRKVEVGEKEAWDGVACTMDAQVINQPDLFGGEEKEGGIQGAFKYLPGAANQFLPEAERVPIVSVGTGFGGLLKAFFSGPVNGVTIPSVKDSLGGLVSEFRGFSAIIFDGLVASMNPYLKEWRFRVWRSRKGWHNDDCWYPAKATIWLADGKIHAMNAAHIVYQCITDPEWGKGEPREAIDEDSFVYAANLFCSEGMGLCIPWYRQEDVDDFIQTVVNHAGAILYQDRITGKYVLRPLRADYDLNDIPHFDLDSGLLEIEEDDSASAEAVNEVIVTGFDPETRQEFEVRAQNIAAWHAHGGPISRPLSYKGLPTRDLCLRKAQQELKLLSAGLKKLRLKFDRRAWQLSPGGVCRISSAENNIENMVVRIGELSEGRSRGQRAIVAKAMEDVFALPSTTFTKASEGDWQSPISDPLPAPSERVIEMGYRSVYRLLGPANAAEADVSDAALGALAISPGGGSYSYNLVSVALGDTDYTLTSNRNYTGSAVIGEAVGPLDTVFALQSLFEFDEDNEGQVFLIDNEEVLLVSYDAETGEGTFARGCSDTLPASHQAGSRLWSLDDDLVSDERPYVSGDQVSAKILPRTGSKVLEADEAAELVVTMEGRQGRPYPPADLKINGVSVFALAGEQGEPIFTWAHRDRVMQEDQPVSHTEPSIGPEVGTTYTIRIYDSADSLIRTEAGIADTTWTYDATKQAADEATSRVRVEMESERDGFASTQSYSFNVILNGGYGYGYGLNYGGL